MCALPGGDLGRGVPGHAIVCGPHQEDTIKVLAKPALSLIENYHHVAVAELGGANLDNSG